MKPDVPHGLERENGSELFRMEKSVLTKTNFDELHDISDDCIPEALLEFICYEHQYNIFGYGLLDPALFCKEFRFSRSYLVSRHDNPYQFQLRRGMKKVSDTNRRSRTQQGEVPQEDIVCANRMENALFVLANYSLGITSTSILEDKTLIRQHEYIRVLEKFSVIQDGRTGKILYGYKLDDKFRRNLSSMYLTASRESLVALRKSRLSSLYIFLLKLRDALFSKGRISTTEDNTPAFGYLCKIAGIPEYAEPKYRKRDLNKALRKVCSDTELDFSVQWVKGQDRERYTPLFNFIPKEDQLVATSDSWAFKASRTSERTDIAVHEFIYNLIDSCPFHGNRYSGYAEEFFNGWIRSEKEEDIRNFTYVFEKTFMNLGCGIPADIPGRVRAFMSLAKSNPAGEITSWARNLFNGLHGYSVPTFRCINANTR